MPVTSTQPPFSKRAGMLLSFMHLGKKNPQTWVHPQPPHLSVGAACGPRPPGLPPEKQRPTGVTGLGSCSASEGGRPVEQWPFWPRRFCLGRLLSSQGFGGQSLHNAGQWPALTPGAARGPSAMPVLQLVLATYTASAFPLPTLHPTPGVTGGAVGANEGSGFCGEPCGQTLGCCSLACARASTGKRLSAARANCRRFSPHRSY